jgi:hypothetical protein
LLNGFGRGLKSEVEEQFMRYESLPSRTQFKKDCGLGGFFKRQPFPALAAILDLLGIYENVPERSTSVRYEILAQTFRHCRYIEQKEGKEDKLRGTLSESEKAAVFALRDYLATNAQYGIALDDTRPYSDEEYVKTYAVWSHANYPKSTDYDDDGNAQAELYFYKADRERFKLSFVNGLIHKKKYFPHSAPQKVLYSVERNDEVENGMVLYVMSPEGKFYSAGSRDMIDDPSGRRPILRPFYHSAFLGGLPVLGAGTLRVERGYLTRITASSGHYRPSVPQMLAVMERLRAYGVDVSRVTLYRQNGKDEYARARTPQDIAGHEACPASRFLQMRQWPGEFPMLMKVDKALAENLAKVEGTKGTRGWVVAK